MKASTVVVFTKKNKIVRKKQACLDVTHVSAVFLKYVNDDFLMPWLFYKDSPRSWQKWRRPLEVRFFFPRTYDSLQSLGNGDEGSIGG